MTLPINPNMAHAFAPPVMEARRWLDGIAFPDDRPLINVSQAAPVDLPHADLRAGRARSSATTSSHSAVTSTAVIADAALAQAIRR